MRTLHLLATLAITLGTSVYGASITIGAPGEVPNVAPFGGPFGTNPGTRYQQAYASSDFASLGSPIVITGIDFLDGNSGAFATDTYTFYLSTISAGIDALSNSNFDSNRGANNSLFANEVLSGFSPSTLTITGMTPFLYDPRQGNLLLDIVVTQGGVPFPNPPTAGYASRNSAAGIFSRYQNFALGMAGLGLVTQFDFGSAPVSVPEPSTALPFLGGLIALYFLSHYR